MRKTLALTLLAASALATGSSSTLCFAEEVANTPSVASPAAAPSQHGTHHMQQTNSDEQDQNKSEEDQGQVDDATKGQTEEQQQEPAGAANQQPEGAVDQAPAEKAPSPSLRDMRQQIRQAQRNTAPTAAGQ